MYIFSRSRPMLLVYLASLLLLSISCIRLLPFMPQLRGGWIGDLLMMGGTGWVSALAVVLICLSPLRRSTKAGLLLLQGSLLLPWAWIVLRMLPILLFFGPGTCNSTFTSPSGAQTVTIETSCFMGCTNILYRNDYLFKTEVGGFYSDANLCRIKDQIKVEWTADETVTNWQIKGVQESIRIQ